MRSSVDLAERVRIRGERHYERMKARLRERYAYARSLGFSVAEAQILSGWSIAHIDEEAQKRAQSNETAP